MPMLMYACTCAYVSAHVMCKSDSVCVIVCVCVCVCVFVNTYVYERDPTEDSESERSGGVLGGRQGRENPPI